MIKFVPLLPDNSHFAKEVFETSFPIDERPVFEALSERNNEMFHPNVVYINEYPVGIFNYWILDKYTYVEHFATAYSCRNNGYGHLIMKYFLENRASKCVVLEVEKPLDETARRRIRFYKRLGFAENSQNYLQPSYHIGGNSLPMTIMSTSVLSSDEFEKVKKLLYKHVYNIGCKCS